MRTFGTFLAVGILALAAGCGGSSGSNGTSSTGRSASNGGQCPGSSSGQSCTGEAAYNTCELNACGAQYKVCFGNNFASGNYAGGACSDFLTCELKCPCDATAMTCEQTCATQYMLTSTVCATCLGTLSACVDSGAGAACTKPVCTTTGTATNTNTNTSTGTNCAALQTCCASAAGAVATACQSALANTGGVDTTCAGVLSGFKTAGYCP
jgi:hypothetical protein